MAPDDWTDRVRDRIAGLIDHARESGAEAAERNALEALIASVAFLRDRGGPERTIRTLRASIDAVAR